MTELRRQVADLVEAAKIRWIEKKVEEMENKYDPRGAWRAMREISAMFAGHIKSAVTMRMRKKDGMIATTDEGNGQTPVNIHLSKQIQTPRLKSENDICKVWLATHRHDRPVKMRRLPVFSWRSKRDQPKISRFRVPFGILAQLVCVVVASERSIASNLRLAVALKKALIMLY